MQRRTIKEGFKLSGIALHSGARSSAAFKPAPASIGIVFVRTDLPGFPKVKASIENVSDASRGTTLKSGEASVAVVEHILAALYMAHISDIIIELNCSEPPALDGSSLPVLSALKGSGIRELEGEIRPLSLQREVSLEEGGSIISASPSDGFAVGFMIDFPGTVVGRQEISLSIDEKSFEKEIAPARTFGFIEEIEELKKRGLALGASLENALAASEAGYLNEPRFKDEAVRHKVLDLIGDLSLIGRPLKARITAERSNHGLNTKFASLLLLEEAR